MTRDTLQAQPMRYALVELECPVVPRDIVYAIAVRQLEPFCVAPPPLPAPVTLICSCGGRLVCDCTENEASVSTVPYLFTNWMIYCVQA